MSQSLRNSQRFARAKRRSHESGSVLVVAMIVLSTLLMSGALAVIKVSRGTEATSEARFQTVALFAAESGVSSAMEFLRANVAPMTYFGAFVSPDNASPMTPLAIAGNTRPHSHPSSLFSGALEMNYEVSLWNNLADPGLSTGSDSDGIVTIRSIGRGPGTSMAILEVTVDGSGLPALPLEVLDWRIVQ